jgi:hypothetical protein
MLEHRNDAPGRPRRTVPPVPESLDLERIGAATPQPTRRGASVPCVGGAPVGPHGARGGVELLYTGRMTELADTFDSAFAKAVDLGNRLADKDKDADLWDIADGLLAGALQYWLYSRQPCGDPRCQDCMPISTAEGRMAELKRLVEQLASESEYFHTPTDANAGRA